MRRISFFSYKGGSGRTSLLFNTLPYLAEELKATEEEPIIVIDLDIDSKGLSLLFHRSSTPNTIQILRDDNGKFYRPFNGSLKEHPLFNGLIPIGDKVGLPAARSVLFVSVNTDSEKNRYLNGNDNFDTATISKLGRFINYCYECNCKAVIMDSSAGCQVSGKKALTHADTIVTVMRITKQFTDGTCEFFQEIGKEESFGIRNKNFILVPNAVPNPIGTTYDLDIIMNFIANKASNSLKNNHLNLNLMTNGNHGVNEVRLFKFEETNLRKKQLDKPNDIQAD